ncbi:hypothetical protein BABINDRAFT_160168 [Babjeviella inositovora NRRL Y-12698]|uniref:Mitochondrial carrier protein n=1 Tax=Babjeviella inositovora NRRL Y-12698 TaxID=984486 RepID=A0A1E3QWE9_9ASCO|nr:uncharacterized protein BABINDRAFT_160168 [Babjeviella inositovora NRRL Y-12698]ODQ81951.1 hypothetical protein BABINDRAFT_160168 [Babjeviella inositovora NRRL Y-12698]
MPEEVILEEDPNRIFKDLFSGTVGGIAQVLSGQPFDTTKVRLQSAPEGTYKGPMDVVRQLIKNEGVSGFYKGSLTPLVGVGACVSIQFAVNQYMKRFFGNLNQKSGLAALTTPQQYLSGCAAGFANGFLVSPIEHIRIRLQTQTGTAASAAAAGLPFYHGPIDCIKKLAQVNGVKSVMRGLGPTLVRETHGAGAYFSTYETLVARDMRNNKLARADIPSYRLCGYGACAGYAMWLTVYPVDVIKSRFQTDNIAKPVYSNSIACAKAIFRSYGIQGFFKGFVPTILRAAPANAATFCAFEMTMRAIG